MLAVTILDGELAWRERPDPSPGTGEMLVAVRAAGVNNADLMQLAGRYPAPAGCPADIPGLELAGEVVEVGPGVSTFAAGERVMAVVGGGAQAGLAVVHERLAIAVPDGMPWDQAGGFPEAFTTAHDALFSQCGLAMGDRLLVNGAAGGVGTAAVQLGVAAGASVWAAVRGAGQAGVVAALGARALVTGTAGSGAGSGPGSEGRGGAGPFDVILELVGAPNMETNLASLAVGGRICVIGTGAGARASVDLGRLMAKRARIHGSTLRARSLEDKAVAARAVEAHVVPLLATGKVRVPVAATWALSDAAAAYRSFAAGGKVGKIVLLTSASD